jgi:hypothetical protein
LRLRRRIWTLAGDIFPARLEMRRRGLFFDVSDNPVR